MKPTNKKTKFGIKLAVVIIVSFKQKIKKYELFRIFNHFVNDLRFTYPTLFIYFIYFFFGCFNFPSEAKRFYILHFSFLRICSIFCFVFFFFFKRSIKTFLRTFSRIKIFLFYISDTFVEGIVYIFLFNY